MKIALSKYIEVIEISRGIILFNKINGNIVMVDKNEIIAEDGNSILVTADDCLEMLESQGYIIEEQKVQEYIRNNCKKVGDTECINLVISTTEKCNLDCEYCYQHRWQKDSIDKEVYSDKVIKYVQQILDAVGQREVLISVRFIGGEPLLEQYFILSLKDRILSTVEEKKSKVNIEFHIDTNGTLLTEEFIRAFPNLTANITLTGRDDHNLMRSNSYDIVCKNLLNLKDVFEKPEYSLIIRYNYHHLNKDSFEVFVSNMANTGLRCSIDVQNVLNTEWSRFTNCVTDREFEGYYLSNVIPVLEKNGFKCDYLPRTGLDRHCAGENRWTTKFYSNGTQVLCDVIEKTDCDHDCKLCDLPEKCISCYDYPLCGGPKLCDKEECTGKLKDKDLLLRRIINYVEQADAY